jgi:hypothetical protein
LTETLEIPTHSIAGVALEDLYTPIDRCLADGLALRDKRPAELALIRSSLDYLIAATIKEEFDKPGSDKEYVEKLATFLVGKAAKRSELAIGKTSAKDAKTYDPFSIINLNWDILVDNALDEALIIRDAACGFGDYDPCCLCHSGVSSARADGWGPGSTPTRSVGIEPI